MPANHEAKRRAAPSSARRPARGAGVERGRRSHSRLGSRYESAAPSLAAPLAGSRPIARKKARLRTDKVLGVILALGLVAVLIYLFVSPTWFVWDIQVVGTRWLSQDDILRAVNLAGMSIFYVEPGKALAALKALPAVEGASIRCRLPDRIEIRVTERQPIAIWQNQGIQYWIDQRGVLFPLLAALEDPLVIVELDDHTRQLGERVDREALQTALEIRRWLPAARVFGYSALEGLSFDLPNGQRVLVPASADVEKKVASLIATRDYLKAKGLQPQVIDLRYDGRAFWR